jgi:hypothetical protein
VAIGRRTFIAGASAIGIGVLVLLDYRSSNPAAPGDVDGLVRDYQKYLDDVAEDYRAGRLIVVDGWIVSASEASDYEVRKVEAQRES